MRRIGLIVFAGAATVAGVAALIALVNRPTSLAGDPWDYNLTERDVPQGWRIEESQLETAYDIAREQERQLHGLLNVHSVSLSHPTAVDVFGVTSQVILYDSSESAKAALAAELLNDEWEQVAIGRAIGDEAALWHLKAVEDAPRQAVYRVDFRYLNGIGSITLTGTVEGMKDSGPALSYANKVLEKMKTAAQPEALRVLANANHPDLREMLLTQADLAQLDADFGDRWLYNSLLPLGWTPNSAMANPESMAQLGRVMGYQVWLVKPLAEEELKPESSTGLFQQVAAYRSPEQAELTLGRMVGLAGGAWPAAPQVGDSAKGWTQELQAQGTSAGSGVVAVTEISFRVSSYVGSIRIQTSAVTQPEVAAARAANERLAEEMAAALAGKLRKVGN